MAGVPLLVWGQDQGWSLPSGVQSWILGSLTVEPGVPQLPSIHQRAGSGSRVSQA